MDLLRAATKSDPKPPAGAIAIVGMSCRLSGDVSTLDDFWTLLSRSRDGWAPIPTERFSPDAYYHPNPQKKGCFNQKGGYFMNRDFSQFDAPFFNITEQEAIAMDPQQRQLLECTYEALENAGLPKEQISGKRMGVFVGGHVSDYRVGTMSKDLNQVPMYDATGNHLSIQAGRLSYFFDLRGPCFSVDTACSSSLYALHAAVQSIQAGESDSAVVGGCSIHLQPDDMVSMSMLGIFSDHGRTYAFDHRAKSGFARGEGCGVVVLKPLEQAIKDNDKIRSVIVSSGTNQDGKTPGLSTPSGEAQEQLIREVYARAGIKPEDTGYIEAHGTGTKTGDPIEAGALYRVFGEGRTKRFPLYMGSVKTNIGHLENASGIISIIKATLMLEKGFILPNVNYEKANPKIPLDEWNLKVPTSIRPWPKNKRFISVNNFGFGGSNAHAVLERPPINLSELPAGSKEGNPKLFVISANDDEAARGVASQLGVYIEQHPEVFQKRLFGDMAYTLSERRTHLPWRVAITSTSCDELAHALNGVDAIPGRAMKQPEVAFVYTGQGAQWPQMGKELMESHPVFAKTVRTASACLEIMGADFSLLEELLKGKDESNVNKAHISQPICTAIQLGLTDLLASWGVKPSTVMGHSSGEIGAAYAAGSITVQEAMAIAYYRGQVASRIKVKHPEVRGSMLAIGASPSEVKQTIKQLGLRNVTVACENSPNSVTASGAEEGIDLLAAELESQSTFNRKLRVDVAYHSDHMQLVADEYMEMLTEIEPKPINGTAFYSSLAGQKLDVTTSLGASYWVDNLTKPVLFSSALEELYTETKPDIIVELGPHSALEGPIKQILKGVSPKAASEVNYFSTLVRNQHATVSTLKLAGNLYCKGHQLDFASINQSDADGPKPTVITDFAPYPWSYKKYWCESRASTQHRLRPFPRHDLLGLLEDSYSESEPLWRNFLSADDIPWLKDHRMQSLDTFPLAGYLCIAVEAAHQRAHLRGIQGDQVAAFRMREVQVSKPFILDDGVQYETTVSLRPYAEGTKSYSNEWDEFRISSWAPSRGWLEHCRGLVGVKKNSSTNEVSTTQLGAAAARREAIDSFAGGDISLDNFYSELGNLGAGYTSSFKLRSQGGIKASKELSSGQVQVPETMSSMPHEYETPSILPTAFMDLFFQFTFAILGAGRGEMKSLYMPSAITEIEISTNLPNQPGQEVQVVANGSLEKSGSGPVDFNIDAWHNEHNEPVAKLVGFRMTPMRGDVADAASPRPLCYKVQWEPLAQQDDASGTSSQNGDSASTNGSVTPEKINGTNGQDINGHISTDGEQLVIITDKAQSDPMVSAFRDLLELRTGSKPLVSRFQDVETLESSRCICFAELHEPLIDGMSAGTFERVQKLLLSCSSMLWVTTGAYRFAENPKTNMAQGLIRTVRSELCKAAATLDLDPRSELSPSARAELVLTAYRTSIEESETDSPVNYEFAEEDGKLMIPRAVEYDELNLSVHRETQPSAPYLQDFVSPGRRLKISVGTFGALDSLYWQDEPEMALAEDEIEIKVAYTGMNFKDVVIAMGQVASPYLGVECSGTVARIGSGVKSLKVGDRVCAMSLGAYGTYARCSATSAARVPDDMGLDVAASIPVVYSTAYYGIVDIARIEPDEKILIHAASGGVGQAAIQLAQMIGAEIFATVGSPEKKQLLLDMYGIPEDHIFYSRDTSFAPAIKEATNGKGVDVVINSLAGDILRETWECLAPFGRFIEIGKRDITSNTRLEMAKFEYNCSFSSVDLTKVAADRPRLMGRILTSVMELMGKKTIEPITPITQVGISEVETALRKLQGGKTLGKVVVNHLVHEQVKATHPAASSKVLRGDATYVIIGGTGGLGRSATKRMVTQGARHVVLLSRSGKMNAELNELAEYCNKFDAKVHVISCDVANETQVKKLVTDVQASLPPIRGVIHAAMVLKDVLFEKMTFDEYEAVVRSKVSGAWNFHVALGDSPLDFFIVLSSVAGVVGNRGQAAYAAANTFLDAFTLFRRRKGLAATALDLTAVEDAGYLAENASKQSQVLKNLSGSAMVESEVLALMQAAIEGDISSTSDGQCITGVHFDNATDMPFFASDGKFARIREEALSKAVDGNGLSAAAGMSIANEVRHAASAEAAQEVVVDGLREKLGAILMIPSEVMVARQASSTITDFGLDSLNAIELRNWIGKELQAHLQVLELLTSGGLPDLASAVLKKTRLEGAWSKETTA